MTDWRAVRGFEGVYEVSATGLVRSLARRTVNNKPVHERLLKARIDRQGYVVYQFTHNGQWSKFGHVLVAEAFIGPRPAGHEVNHKDGVKSHNSLENLEYVTPRANCLHKCRVLGQGRGDLNGKHKLTQSDIPKIRESLALGESHRTIARRYGVTHRAIGGIALGRTWAYVPR